MAAKILTQEYLRSLIHYDPLTGRITRKNKAFGSYSQGYLLLKLGDHSIMAHRAAWIYTHGDIDDDKVIDHINGVRDDNRIVNLRMVTQSENMRNIGVKHTPSKLQIMLQEDNWFFHRFKKLV